MILSGEEIRNNLGSNIVIDPFDETNLNPNSYNLTLHDELLTYEEVVLDLKQPNRVRRVAIPESRERTLSATRSAIQSANN